MRKQRGFTLIELLVVIAIIGLLSTLAVVALNNARQKSRDAKRVSDIKQIQTALELYYNDANAYPTALTFGTGSIASGGTTYMSIVPDNPARGTTALVGITTIVIPKTAAVLPTICLIVLAGQPVA